ncbi:MAG: PilZ domain-containing protein [Candidatus Sulfotelmatobacter sp.]|jgi:DNA-binding NarL/FixJ family response regulator
MNLSALLVCVDETASQVLRQVLGELSIRVETCSDMVRAGIRLAQERFDVMVFDCGSQRDVTTLLKETRLSRLNDATLAVAVVPGQDNIREMFSLGVNFVLYKPVSYERALSSLRAARAVMRKEKRRKPRATVHAHATIDYADVAQEKATLVDLAEDGMSVRFGKKFPPTTKVYFQFQLPDQSAVVRLSGQVVWQDWNGRSGIQFVDVPKASRRLITDFLRPVLPAAQVQESVAGVTVEMEEPPQAVGVGAERVKRVVESGADRRSEPRHDGGAEPAGAGTETARLRAEAGNRRDKMRYACRLGAQVFRTGIAVPIHCCLTDLSTGGCYLEVSLPFAKGTSVEIIVHTHEIKLSLRGAVQASHPGFGMGIAFDLKTKDERDTVQKLTDFVVASAESAEEPENSENS